MDRSRRPDGRRLSTGAVGPVGPSTDAASLLARCRFPAPGAPVSCAVSGGTDSMALMVLAVAAGCRVTAVHVDHGLRPGSAAEAEVVATAAVRFGAEFRAERVSVAPGGNLEARARAARLAVLPPDATTGHTADDRAESMLLNLIRGAGPAGMVGMARSPRRPIIDLRRGETRALCDALGLVTVDDPSNADPRFARNRVRHEVLPLLGAIGDRDLVPVLVRQADLFAHLDAQVRAAASGVDATSADDLAAAPRAVAGAAIQAWLVRAGVGRAETGNRTGAGPGRDRPESAHVVDAASIDRVLAVANREQVATEVAGGWRVARSAGRLSIQAPTRCKDADHG